MKKYVQPAVFLLLFGSWVAAQSALDGTSFDASIYNFPDSVGSVRLIDTAGTNCRVDGGPLGDDKPTAELCLVEDSGIPPVSLTFNAGAQPVGGALITPVVTPYAGLPEDESIVASNAASGIDVPLDWSRAGDLLEFLVRTPDDSFPAEDDLDYWGFSATGIQYPNALADSEVVLPFDEEPGNYTNFYFWYEDKDGPIIDGYLVGLPVGLGVGRHPSDPNREVLYPIYSTGQADEQTDTVAGGSLDFYSHGSILDPSSDIGNALFLADNTTTLDDALETVTGFGFGLLVQPPEMESTGVAGDFDGDMVLTANDIDLLSMQVGGNDLSFDLNSDGSVTGEDRTVWINDLAGVLAGDTDLSGGVDFTDFLSLSGAFGGAGGWADGDSDGSGDVQFPDFLTLSGNFGKSVGDAESVPEPTAGLLLMFGVAMLGSRRRSRRKKRFS